MYLARDVSSFNSVDTPQFKSVMRRIASTVTVITSASGSIINGMTATAVCSVSVEPPCILVVVNQANKSHSLIEDAGVFAVNVLSEEQEHLAQHFALKSDNPFEAVTYRGGVTGVPVITECVANLECIVQSQTRSGTHSIFVGRVVHTDEAERPPLLHINSGFTSPRTT